MLNKYFQNTVYKYVGIIDSPFGIIDEEGVIVASSLSSTIGRKVIEDVGVFSDESVIFANHGVYRPVFTRSKFEFCVFIERDDDVAEKCVEMLATIFLCVKQNYEEKFDCASFVKNILLDSILPGDIYARSKELKLEYEKSRIAFVVSLPSPDDSCVFSILKGMFPEKGKQFVVPIDEKNFALILEMNAEATVKEKTKIVNEIINTVRSEAMINVCVGIGSVVTGLRELSLSYREAQLAIEIGNVFDSEKEIFNYESLGIGRLIYQLPVKICQMFLDEVFKNGSMDKLDNETIITIQKFFDNSLNISETSRKLFIHRNTLVYRLDKIQKLTGLDLREFDDAIIFKVAMMVKKYLSANIMKI